MTWYYDHPAFRDVIMEVQKKFYIKEKRIWSLKIRWWHRRGWLLSDPYRIKMSHDKFVNEFKITEPSEWLRK